VVVGYAVLGPLAIRRPDGREVTIAGPARRLLLAALLCRAGTTVPTSVLIEDLWGPAPPRTAAKTLQSHVVRLRDDLGRDEAARVLHTDAAGYRFLSAPDELDVEAFLDRLAHARAADDAVTAIGAYDAAVAVWRGEPYADFPEAPFAAVERVRLTELRLLAEEERTDIALALGQAPALIPELERRVSAAPYRERGWEQLMLALYRSGRQADALASYRRVAMLLDEDLGVDPGPALDDLQRRVLQHDEGLLHPSAPVAVVSAHSTDRCPYAGLAPYDLADSDIFVGRERLTAGLVGLLAEHPIVVMAGGSGTGKSSILRAGLVPALHGGALPGSAAWKVIVRTPTELAGDPAVADLIVVDQAEELFTTLDSSAREFVARHLVDRSWRGERVVLGIRGDFYARLTEVDPLDAYAQEATLLAAPLRADEVRRVVTEPAARLGLRCDEDLVETVLDEMGDHAGALPLLSAALAQTWANREGDRLTLAGYRAAGGIAASVEQAAERVYTHLAPNEQAAARLVLVRLAQADGDAWVRKPLRLRDVPHDEATGRALDALAAARLITLSADRAEVTHEALFAAWPRLRGWLEERRQVFGLLEHLDSAARDWDAAGHPDSDLYRGARLQTTLDWVDEHLDEVTPLEVAFVRASAASSDRELSDARARADEESRGRRRLRRLSVVLVAVVVLLGAATAAALSERSHAADAAQQAQRAALVADVRRLATLSASAPDIPTASLLAVAADRLLDTPETRGAMLAAVERSATAQWRVKATHTPVALAVSPDARTLAYSDDRGEVTILNTTARRRIAQFPLPAARVVGVGDDATALITLESSPRSPDSIGELAVLDVATGRTARVLSMAVTADGVYPTQSANARWLAAVTSGAAGPSVSIWDTRNWDAPPRTFPVAGDPVALAVSDGAVAYEATDGSIDVRSLPQLEPRGRVAPAAGAAPGRPSAALAVSSDGTRVVRADLHAPERIVEYLPASGTILTLPAQPAAVDGLAFGAEDQRLAVASSSGSVVIYRTLDWEVAADLPGPLGGVTGIAWSEPVSTPTDSLFTSGYDGNVVMWSVGAPPAAVDETAPLRPLPDRGEIFGHWLIGLTPVFGTVPPSRIRWYRADLDTGETSSWPAGLVDDRDGVIASGDHVNQISASIDGRVGLLEVTDKTGGNRVDVWDLGREHLLGHLQLPGSFAAHFLPGLGASLSSDGRTVYATIDRDRIGVFALPSGQLERAVHIDFRSPSAARTYARPLKMDPEGRLLLAGVDTGPSPSGDLGAAPLSGDPNTPSHQMLALLDPTTGRLAAQVDTGDDSGVSAEAWSDDGARLAVGSGDGTLTLYAAATLRPIATAASVEPGPVRSVSFTSDGSILVEAGAGGGINLFDAADLTRVGSRVEFGDASSGQMFAWAGTRDRIAGFEPVATSTGDVYARWFTLPLDRLNLIRTACGLAGTDMTRTEWRSDVGDRPFQHVCGG
jgi:DNA-binding SARP family transcriptional activator/WD40 repeat protein